jgi:hypothetical protein
MGYMFNYDCVLGSDHLTCMGGGYGIMFFCFVQNFFFGQHELEYNFFLQNLILGYVTKTLNQFILFFPPPKSEYFFQQHWESEYFFRKIP